MDEHKLRAPDVSFIGFYGDGGLVGELRLENPLRFEGNAEESTRVFFRHVVAINSRWLLKAKALLEAANCPECGDNSGAYARECVGYDGEPDFEMVQCQWCDEKSVLLRELVE